MMTIKDAMIGLVLKTVVNRVNNSFDLNKVLDRYNADGRTMMVIITDIGEGTGFSIVNGTLVSGAIENPTCTVRMTKDILAAIVTNKLSQQQAFLMGGVDIESNERLRDSIVLNKIFDEMRGVIVKT
jgi:putative sterol carrier protein